jgi:predicted nuclease of restriction endonuclease-like (RecB) superfamily
LKALPVFEELSLSDLRHSNSNEFTVGSSDAEEILSNLRALREQIVTAWSERGVVLNRPEQAALHAEIKETCEFLTALTRHA